MFRSISTLALVCVLTLTGYSNAKDPVTERPSKTALQPKLQVKQAQAATLANAVLTGKEDVNNGGRLGFSLQQNGVAIMVDAVSTVKGSWTQEGNKVTIRFKNCVYQGTLAGDILTGKGTITEGPQTGSSWGFRVVRGDVLRGTEFRGQENLNGFGRLTFRFGDNNRVEMIDARTTVRGTYSVNGNQVTIRFNNCVYTGQMQDGRITGSARYTQGSGGEPWTFEVNMGK